MTTSAEDSDTSDIHLPAGRGSIWDNTGTVVKLLHTF